MPHPSAGQTDYIFLKIIPKGDVQKRRPKGISLVELCVAHGHYLTAFVAFCEKDRRLHIPAGVSVDLLVPCIWNYMDKVEKLVSDDSVA